MLSDTILDHEFLYRSVPSRPSHWVVSEDRPSSAVFKDPKGVSVDRDGDREEQEIIASFGARKGKDAGLILVTASQCRTCGAYPLPKPLDDNPYLAEIHDGKDKVKLSRAKANALAESSRIVKRPTF